VTADHGMATRGLRGGASPCVGPGINPSSAASATNSLQARRLGQCEPLLPTKVSVICRAPPGYVVILGVATCPTHTVAIF
jgi:hypothetical protein